jgi:hypothetical protein
MQVQSIDLLNRQKTDNDKFAYKLGKPLFFILPRKALTQMFFLTNCVFSLKLSPTIHKINLIWNTLWPKIKENFLFLGQEKLRRERIIEAARKLEGVLPINVEEIFPNVKWPKDGPHLCTIVNRATEYAKWLKRELKKLTKIAENGLFYVEQLLP